MDDVESLKALKALGDRITELPTDDTLRPQIRKELQGLVKEAGFALEQPLDTMNRLVFLVSEDDSACLARADLSKPFQHSVARVAIDLGLFEYLADAGAYGMELEDIASKTRADATLLARMLRTLANIGLAKQMDSKRWTATSRAQAILIPSLQAGFRSMFDFIGPVFQKMPDSLAKNGYRCPTALQGPFQDAYGTKLSGWDFVMEPQFAHILVNLNVFMQGRRLSSPSWLDFYPFSNKILQDATEDHQSVLVVDVGGGLGHGLIEIKGRFPNIKGRLILQDLPNTIEQAEDHGGAFESMAHDFFTPQTVKGARAYLIRQVLHDWPDAECQKILQHLAAAMQPGYSKLLINEFIIPDVGASDFITAVDLTMMMMSGGMERTESQWRKLLASAGLDIERIWSTNGEGQESESVIEAILMKA
ncbi:MAG: hypothetical protein Q9183_005969 [Haloplaca sp. 2 TL-2023]